MVLSRSGIRRANPDGTGASVTEEPGEVADGVRVQGIENMVIGDEDLRLQIHHPAEYAI